MYQILNLDKSMSFCTVDGGWGDWLAWEECSKTCGLGERVRMRKCNNPAPFNGGRPCQGEAVQRLECNLSPCPGTRLDQLDTIIVSPGYKMTCGSVVRYLSGLNAQNSPAIMANLAMTPDYSTVCFSERRMEHVE